MTDTRCPVCGNTKLKQAYSGTATREIWDRDTHWSVVECEACEHRFTSPPPSAEVLDQCYSAMYPAYDAGHGLDNEIDKAIEKARKAGVHRHVRIEPGIRLLDVGCGSGTFLRVAQAFGADVMGVEPSEFGVATCKKLGVPVFHGDLTAYLETAPEPFDLITSNHVVEHHPDPVALLGEMKSLLAPGGKVWISVPNAGCFFARALKASWHSADLPVHLQQFTERSLRETFDQAGLSTLEVRTGSEGSLAGSLSALLRKRAMIPQRLSTPALRPFFGKDRYFERVLDARGQGEALIATAQVPTAS